MSFPAPLNLNFTVNCTDSCNGIFCCSKQHRPREKDVVIYDASSDSFVLVRPSLLLSRFRHSSHERYLYSQTRAAILNKFFKPLACRLCRESICPGCLVCESENGAKPVTVKEFRELQQAYKELIAELEEPCRNTIRHTEI